MRLRPLVIVLAVQIVLGAVLLWLIASGTLEGWLTDDDNGGTTAAAPAAVARPAKAVNRFDGAAAYAWAKRIVALGPRPAGSETSRRVAAMLRPALPGGKLDAVPGGLQNVVGSLQGNGPTRPPILVIAHYDTTPVEGYVGANNSAAAVGAVIELARALKRYPGGRPVRFVLTDGEEAPTYPVQGDFTSVALRGSRHEAASGPRPSAVIVLDFVGQKNLRIPREQGSDPALWARLRAAAKRVGVARVFPNEERGVVFDDHTPFARRGIPAIDLIDFDYPCWQKPCDTVDKLDARSIDASGEAVLELVRELRRR
jgi:glutaminyl-peptide cyclotransferase